jgi:tetratricopeptide (TPR) repeat protein
MVLEKYINSSTDNDDDLTSGVALGVGCFSLILSMLPGSVVKVAEFIGFTSDREHGLEVLGGSNHGLRSDFCDMVLITYHIVLSKIIPLSHVDEKMAVEILNNKLKKYPNGVFFLYLFGRAKMSDRQLWEAKKQYQRAIDIQEDWKQLHHMCYWELGLISLIEKDYTESVRIYDLLGKESNWSKAVYCYLKSVALYMLTVNEEDCDKKMEWMKEAEASMSKVTSEKKKIAGKSIPMEVNIKLIFFCLLLIIKQ